MKELVSEIVIDQPPGAVWRVLTDFSAYPQWNRFIPAISGNPRPGGRLTVAIDPPDSKGMTFRPKVLVANPNEELRWVGRVLIPGLFDGEHSFHLEPLGNNRTRFTQRERFRGALVPLMWNRIGWRTHRGFEQMNAALKERVESLRKA